MKIAFFGLAPYQRAYLDGMAEFKALEVSVDYYDEHVGIENIESVAGDKLASYEAVSVFVASTLDKNVLDKMPNLKFIATRSTGFDHIDILECKRRGIVLSCVPSYGENTVAEFTFALLLMLTRKVGLAYDNVRERGDFSHLPLRGVDLAGKTIGVVGTGRIGRHVVNIARGFGMNVVASDPFPNKELEMGGVKYFSLDELLPISDVVTLHVPYSEENHHMLNEGRLRKMRRGSYLINTARGGLVDTSALARVMGEGHLAGVGLDVFEEEDIVMGGTEGLKALIKDTDPSKGHDLKAILADHVLIDMPNVIVTPHIAYNTTEAMLRILKTTVENIVAYGKGEPVNLVNQK